MPNIGDIQTYIRDSNPSKVLVLVRVFKMDTIRQEAYWVTKEVREFKSRALAEAYVARKLTA